MSRSIPHTGAGPPYVGSGARYQRSSVAVTVDGLRSTARRAGWKPNAILGARLNAVRGRPFLEWKTSDGRWALTIGARLRLAGQGG